MSHFPLRHRKQNLLHQMRNVILSPNDEIDYVSSFLFYHRDERKAGQR